MPVSGGELAEERKIVTVLFCDLVDFTATSDAADPEDVRARLRPYHALVRAEIERYGGTVEKFIGDAVMGVYGAPMAHEDDAERAVRSALRTLDAIAELNGSHPGLDLQVRIGVATGEAVVSLGARPEQGEGMVAGDVVNTASRLQGVAPVGGIAVGEQTYRATRALFDYEALEPVTLKGKAETVPIWRPLAPRSRMGTDAGRARATPLVGRELEKRLLEGLFERTVRERAPQLVTIVGEPGVGKSRLVGELFAHIDAMPGLMRWRQGRCLPYGEGITFWALGEVVKGELGILESDPPEVALDKLDRALAEGPEREWLRQRLLPLLGLEATSTAEREELFTAWRRFLELLAESAPTVLVFEDLHWADDAMLAFLEHVAGWAEGVPLVVIGTARPELFEGHPTWASAARNATRINLGPLSEAETTTLVSLLLERAVLPGEMESLVLERAGGNPLYAEEFVRLLKDRGLLRRDRGTVTVAQGSDLPAPESVQALIAARLDTLSADRKAMLHDAAVIGKVFWAGAVAAMGQLDERAVVDALHELSRKELVRPIRVSSVAGESEYAFWHVLVRDVAYSQIPRAGRADRHRRAATWIESIAGERVEDHAEILAYHHTTALDLARAVGQGDIEALERSARRFLVLAGERALGLDTAKAEANLAAALRLAPPGDPERPIVLARWADAAHSAGRHSEAARALEEAIEGFRQRGDVTGAARSLTTLADVLWFSGDPRSVQVATEAERLLRDGPPGPDLVAAEAELARQQVLRGALAEGIGWADRALALARDLGLEESPKALGYRALGRCVLGDGGGLDDFRRALALALAQGRGRETSVLHTNLGISLWPIEGPAASAAAFREGIAFADARGIVVSTEVQKGEILDALVDLGSWDEVLSAGAMLAEEVEADWSLASLFDVRRAQVRVLVMRGDARVAVPLAEWAVEAGGRVSSDRKRISLCLSALANLGVGDAERARAAAIRLSQTPRFWQALQWPAYLPAMVRASLALGDVKLAERFLAHETAHPYRQHAQVAGRAAVAEAKRDLDEAARLYAEAAARWDAFRVVPEHAFALLGWGRSLLAAGRAKEASEPLAKARDIFATLGARPALLATEALIGSAPVPAS